ncbi:hypothetical protein ABMA77_06655 [Halobacteriovorax sp. RZ-1]|uniref:hypothetical protein n=1 Tax=unclassified Halobacteriovorax TaxID=2639665 RepID=UPI003721B7DC
MISRTKDRLIANLMNTHLYDNPESKVTQNQKQFLDFIITFEMWDFAEVNYKTLRKWFEEKLNALKEQIEQCKANC